MLRGLLRPRWLLVHVGVALLVVLMVNLGFWQLRRLDQKRAFNSLVTTRSEMPVAELTRLENPIDPVASEWRRVSVEGTYRPEHAVRVVNRSQDGAAGYDEVIPLLTKRFGWVIVNRGFVPLAIDHSVSAPAEPLTVVGYLRVAQRRGVLGAVDSTDLANRDFQRFDIPLMSRQLDGTVFPMYLQLVEESPSTAQDWPTPVAFPELSEGPHQSYAFQWFFFSTVAIAGWAVVVRRKWREVAPSEPTPE